jgi:hypothetical protein
VPSRSALRRVQFWNGFSMNQVSGTTIRRSSQMRTTT